MKGGNLNLEQANHDATKVSVIGEMNHRILLYQNKYVRDTAHPYNSQSKKIFLAEVWANVSNLSGNEYYAAAMVRVQKEVSMTFRYHAKSGLITAGTISSSLTTLSISTAIFNAKLPLRPVPHHLMILKEGPHDRFTIKGIKPMLGSIRRVYWLVSWWL